MPIFQRIREFFLGKSHSIRREMEKKAVTFIFASLGVITGLAWNDAFQAFIKQNLHLDTNSTEAKFLYAALLTIVVVVATVLIGRLFESIEENKK